MLVTLPAAASGVYKWVDADGRTHYGATPPSAQEATELHLRGVTPPASAEAAAGSEEPNTGQATAVAQERSENCETARQNLAVLENTAITQFRDADGQIVSYSESQRAQLTEEARAQIQYFCR
jgi:hypothetical protein